MNKLTTIAAGLMLLVLTPAGAGAQGGENFTGLSEAGMQSRQLKEQKDQINKLDLESWQRQALSWVALDFEGAAQATVTKGKNVGGVVTKKDADIESTGDETYAVTFKKKKKRRIIIEVPVRGQSKPLRMDCDVRQVAEVGNGFAGIFLMRDGGFYCLDRPAEG